MPTGVAESESDRVSVTDVNGSVARFDMTYSPPAHPRNRSKFGPPLRMRIPSALYLAGALVLGSVVCYAYGYAPSSSRLFVWVVEGDRGRPVPASILAAIIVVSALATVVRTQMRGVIVSEDWLEVRALLPLGVPRARRWGWPQVLRVVVDRDRIGLELWDGTFERLPEVARAADLASLMVMQAARHRIDVSVLDPTPQ
ncbi:MAG: hypothetical protein ABSF69_07450 [Polyangiaceae bacterium]